MVMIWKCIDTLTFHSGAAQCVIAYQSNLSVLRNNNWTVAKHLHQIAQLNQAQQNTKQAGTAATFCRASILG
jgi:hypothetical protein